MERGLKEETANGIGDGGVAAGSPEGQDGVGRGRKREGEEPWVRAQGTPSAQPEQLTVTQGSSKGGSRGAAGGLRGRELRKFSADGPHFLPNTRKRMIYLLGHRGR